MTATLAGLSATFSVDELTALANLGGARRFPGVADRPAASPQVDDAVRRVARRGLVARGVVVFDGDGRLVVDEWYHELVSTALIASIVVALERREAAREDRRQLYVSPSSAVEHAVAVSTIHRLTRVAPENVAALMLDVVQLEPRPAPPGTEHTVPGRTIGAIYDALRRGDAGTASEAAGASGFGDAIVDGFRALCSAQTLRRQGGVVDGGEVRWIDTDAGLYQVAPAERRANEPHVTVAPVSGSALADEILSYLISEQIEPAAA